MATLGIEGFYTFTVIIDGALDIDEYVLTDANLHARILDVATDAAGDFEAGPDGDGFDTQVFFMWHDHPPTVEECSCVQYLTDHRPAYIFPQDLCHFSYDVV